MSVTNEVINSWKLYKQGHCVFDDVDDRFISLTASELKGVVMTIKGIGNVCGKWAYVCPDCNKYMFSKFYKSLLAEITTHKCN